MGTEWRGFAATDTVKNPAPMREFTTILHAPKPGMESESQCGAPGKPYRGRLGTRVSRNVRTRVPSEGPDLDAFGD